MANTLFVIKTQLDDRPIVGYDTTIAKCPPEVYGTVDGQRAVRLDRLHHLLYSLSYLSAMRVNEQLHHGDWVLTSDPAEVQTRGLLHDCVACRVDVDRATAAMRDDPDLEILVGTLFWAG